MLRELKILLRHGKQAIPDLDKVELTELFRGRPVISPEITGEEAAMLTDLCPAGAISASPEFSIDLGKCVFCRECEFACPGKIKFTNDYRIATSRREDLLITASGPDKVRVGHEAIRPVIRNMFSRSLKLRQVSAAGDNSNEMELNAAGNVNFDMGRFGIEFVASPRHADGVVITGPVSENMAAALKLTWEAIAEPKIIVVVGTDAISGGLFADSPAIDRSFFDTHKPDLFVPGNPAHPLTFIHGILDLIRR